MDRKNKVLAVLLVSALWTPTCPLHAEDAPPEGSATWLGRLVVLSVKDGALVLDREAWTRWAEAQPVEDAEARKKRVAEQTGFPIEHITDDMLESLDREDGPPVVALFRRLMSADGRRGGSGSHSSDDSMEEDADSPGFRGDLRLSKQDQAFCLELVEEVGRLRRLRVEESATSGLSVSFQGRGTSVLLLCGPDGTTAVAATHGEETCRRTGRSLEELLRSAPDEMARCLARPLAEIGIALPGVEGFAPPSDVRLDGLGVSIEELERASSEAAKRVDTSIATIQGHSGQAHGVAFSPDGVTLLVGCADGAISLCDARTWRESRRFERAGQAGVFSPDGGQIAAWSRDEGLAVIDLASGEVSHHADCHAMAAAFAPDGKLLYVGEMDGQKGRIDAVELPSWRVLRSFHGTEESGWMGDFALSRDGRSLAGAFLGRMEGQILLWDAEGGTFLRSLTGHTFGTYGVAFGREGGDLFSGGRVGDLRRWDAATGEVKLVLEVGRGSLPCIAVNPAGDLVARGDREACAKVREVATGRELAAFRGHRGRVESVAWSPDGAFLVTGSEDGTAKVWRVSK